MGAARRLPAIAAALFLPTGAALGGGHDVPGRVVFHEDFEGSEPLMERWTPRGELTATRRTLAATALADRPPGPRVLSVTAGRHAGIETTPLEAVDFADVAELRLWLRAAADPPVALEVHFFERDRAASFWRRVRVADDRWHEIVVPLRWCRWSDGAAPGWDAVNRIGLRFRGGRDRVEIDNIALVAGEAGAALLSPAAVAEVAFEGRACTERRIGPFVVLTDAPAALTPQLERALEQLDRGLQADTGLSPPPDRPASLLLFARTAEYRAFWPRLGAALNARIVAPASDGFTSHGIASSSCGPDAASVRPVWVHEAAHAWFAAATGLDNHGEWLQEGLATRHQLRFSGDDLAAHARALRADPGRRMPFDRLLAGGDIPAAAYGQAALITAWMLRDADAGAEFARLLRTFRARCSTDMRPLAHEPGGKSPGTLEREWLAWLQTLE